MTELWTVIRMLHLLAVAFFVGGQLFLVVSVAPAARRHDAGEAMRSIARRFGIGAAGALAVLVATGAAMASREDRWGDGTLHVKLALVVLVALLAGLHAVLPRRRALSIAVLAASLAIVWAGVDLAHG